MATVKEHYDHLLAEHYSWMFGDFSAKTAREAELLSSLLGATPPGRAVDLGAGCGFQTLALARMGWDVTAIDLSEKLLAELRMRAKGLAVTTVAGEMLDAARLCPHHVSLAVCMGDTLTHLASLPEVRRLAEVARRLLVKDGLFLLTFRDLTRELKGLDRFIPVRSDETTIFTCFLEFEAEHVAVTDLVQRHTATGWDLKKSSYKKLRLSADQVACVLNATGFVVERAETAAGFVHVVAKAI